MVRKAVVDEGAEPGLDGHVHLGDQVDRALLVDPDALSEAGHLHLARVENGLDGRGKPLRIVSHAA